MKRRYYGRRVPRGQEQHLAGVRALADGECAAITCDEPILKEQRIVPAGPGRWMHTTCASGADDA